MVHLSTPHPPMNEVSVGFRLSLSMGLDDEAWQTMEDQRVWATAKIWSLSTMSVISSQQRQLAIRETARFHFVPRTIGIHSILLQVHTVIGVAASHSFRLNVIAAPHMQG